eukprot:403342250
MNEKSSASRNKHHQLRQHLNKNGGQLLTDRPSAETYSNTNFMMSNRGAEIELKQFDKPVIDFDANKRNMLLNQQKQTQMNTVRKSSNKQGYNQLTTINGGKAGGDTIDEEFNYKQTSSSMFLDQKLIGGGGIGGSSGFFGRDINGNPLSPILETYHNQQNQLDKTSSIVDLKQSIKLKRKRINMLSTLGYTLCASALLALSFIGLSFDKHQQIAHYFASSIQDQSDQPQTNIISQEGINNNKSNDQQLLVTQDGSESEVKYYLPFYSQKLLFSCGIFLISTITILLNNCLHYKRFGVFSYSSELYTNPPAKTLKTFYLFLCLIVFLISQIVVTMIFDTWKITKYELNSNNLGDFAVYQSINTTLVCGLIAFFLILAKFFLQGKRVQIIQKIGLFISLIGIIVTAMALTRGNLESDETIKNLNFNLGIVALITVMILIWQHIKIPGDISYTTSTQIILFLHGLSSSVTLVIILIQGKFYYQDQTYGYTGNALKSQIWMILMSSLFFSMGSQMLGGALDHRPFSKIYAFTMLIPILHLLYDNFLNSTQSSSQTSTQQFSLSHLIPMTTILIGSLFIILGEPKHSNAHIYMNSGGESTKNPQIKGNKQIRDMQDPLLDLDPRINHKTANFIDADDTIL